MAIKSRVFNIMQYETHPETNEPLLNEETIKDALNHRTIKRWAYVCHDKDVYSALDEEQNPNHTKGEKKPRHWHIAIEMGSNQAEIGTIAKWFKIQENFVNVAKGAGAFLDIVKYLTHEDEKQQALNKHLYEDEEINANFDFRLELDRRAENKLKYGRDLSDKDQQRHDVLYNGKTLSQCMKDDKILYMNDYRELQKLRLEYIKELPAPLLRQSFYISGRGGLGKGLCSKALARSLCPHLTKDEEIYFIVGNGNAKFEGYDGQPVIIWDDMRAYDLLTCLGGRGNVFNVFDTHPTKQRQNVKYGSINLCNTFNIVNSIQPYEEFLDGLAGEYKDKNGDIIKSEDKGQSYRRVPYIINLHEEDFDILLNKGFMYGTSNFTEYEEYKTVKGNMQRIAERCKNNEKLLHQLNNQMLLPIVEKTNEIAQNHLGSGEMSADEEQAILNEFAEYGQCTSISSHEDLAIYEGKVYDLKVPENATPLVLKEGDEGFLPTFIEQYEKKPIGKSEELFPGIDKPFKTILDGADDEPAFI